jgi:hypothetical protein
MDSYLIEKIASDVNLFIHPAHDQNVGNAHRSRCHFGKKGYNHG